MKPTIENLWNGSITPGETCGVHDPEIEHLVYLQEKNRNKLESILEKQQKELLDKYIDCAEEYAYLISARAFSDGFCLASKLLTEALSEGTL